MPRGVETLLRFQRSAGNGAVASAVQQRSGAAASPGRPGVMAVDVQRCAPKDPGCACPAEDKQAAELITHDPGLTEEPPVQRVMEDRHQPGQPTVQRAPPAAAQAGVSFQGRFFAGDPAQLRTTLEILVVEKGAEGAESFAYAFLRMGMEDRLRLQLKGTDPALIDQVQAAFEPVLQTFQKERNKYVESFRDEAAAGAQIVLTKSRDALNKERDKYTGEGWPVEEPDLDGLRAAAKALAARRHSADAAAAKAKDAFGVMRRQLQTPAHPGSFAPAPIVPYFPDPALREAAGTTNEAWYQEEQSYAKLRTTHEATFPALAMYTDNEDGKAASRLEDLPTWGILADRRLKKNVVTEIDSRIGDNLTASRSLNDKEKAWELPKIIDLTLKGKQAKPFEEKWVRHRVGQVHEEAAERQRLLAAITVGFAVAAGILTAGAAAAPAGLAGTAVLAGLATAAQAGTTALTIATAYQELMDYRFKKATQETSLDRADSIAGDDPSFLWLAVTLVGAIAEVSALKAAFVTLKGSVQAARAARNTVGLAEEVVKIRELTPAAGESITNRVKAEIDAMAPQVADPGTLKATAGLSSDRLAQQPDLLRHEFQLAQSSPARRAIQGEVYSEEVIMENGHVWRKQRENGRWCRFSSDPLCFIFGETGDGHIDSFSAPRKARQGEWSGVPGKSDFTPNDPVALIRARYRPIPYRNGYPDFSQFAEERALIPRDQYAIPDRNLHERLADRALARSRGWLLANGDPDVARAVAFRTNPADPLTWHHVEGDNVLLLVPRSIHRAAQHAGGFSIPALAY
ncbi:HNH endonuclease [Planotetraspora mira]|uniref:HNH endonuclease n=1 Tax=Planotetraspora mira TaxID=58121 RepID=UPI001951C468|nr:HNH endonuclease [Planotetraspora mira]